MALECEIGGQSDALPYYIKAIEAADFRWEEEKKASDVDRLLQQNAPALLLSYLRPIISQMTEASPYKKFDIPFMNFTK